jgi:hypothetical protein
MTSLAPKPKTSIFIKMKERGEKKMKEKKGKKLLEKKSTLLMIPNLQEGMVGGSTTPLTNNNTWVGV